METVTATQLRKLIPADTTYEYNHIEDTPRFKSLARAMLRSCGGYPDKVYAIHNEYGLLCLSAGSCEQDALDNAVDNDCMDSVWIKLEDLDEEQTAAYYSDEGLDEYCSLGNASELFDLTYIGMNEVVRT